MTSLVHLSDNHRTNEQHDQAKSETQQGAPATMNSQTMVATPSTDYMMPYGHLEVGHAMGQIVYPNIDPYYGGMYAAYGGQAVMHPQLVGVQHAGLPLPTDAIEEPVYVNAKQYNAILRRRQSRAKAESENKFTRARKPYLHESRHRHALKRARGSGGRFLNAKADENKEENLDSNSGNELNGVASPDNRRPSTSQASENAYLWSQQNNNASNSKDQPSKNSHRDQDGKAKS